MLKTSISPHIHSNESIASSMWNVNLALLPVLAASVYFFGMRALWLVIISVVAALFSELFMQLVLRKRITIFDGSAVITGILVAFNMPPAVPFYVPVVGTLFAIIVVKHLFGGLGNNIFNPALAGRVFVMFAWLPEMTTWNIPLDPEWINQFNFFNIKIDTITSATPLAVNKLNGFQGLIKEFGSKFNLYKQLFLGNVGGCIGETSAMAILIGGIYLIVRKVITGVIPFFYLLTVFLISILAGHDPVFHLLAGGLFLGAFFMATDYVASPFTLKGGIIYAVGCGLLTALLRLKGGLPEGVSFSILLMNALTPLIDRYTRTKIFGNKRKQ